MMKLARLIDWSRFDDADGRFYHEQVALACRPGLWRACICPNTWKGCRTRQSAPAGREPVFPILLRRAGLPAQVATGPFVDDAAHGYGNQSVAAGLQVGDGGYDRADQGRCPSYPAETNIALFTDDGCQRCAPQRPETACMTDYEKFSTRPL